jgi:hypothetical protein
MPGFTRANTWKKAKPRESGISVPFKDVRSPVSLASFGTFVQTTGASAHNANISSVATTSWFTQLTVLVKPYNVTIDTPAGWSRAAEIVNGSVASGADTGSVRLVVFEFVGEPGTTVPITFVGTPTALGSRAASYRPASSISGVSFGNSGWLAAYSVGYDDTQGANYSAVHDAAVGAKAAADLLFTYYGSNSDLPSGAPSLSFSIPGTGLGFQNLATNSDAITLGDNGRLSSRSDYLSSGFTTGVTTALYTSADTSSGASIAGRISLTPEENTMCTEAEYLEKREDAGFPDVTAEIFFDNNFSEEEFAPGGATDVTQFISQVSGSLRGRTYEIGEFEAGTLGITLDNSDGRFTPGSHKSPYFPNIEANRRFRLRGKNIANPNIATGGGRYRNTLGFFVPEADETVYTVTYSQDPVVGTHNQFLLPDGIGDRHIEARLAMGATAGVHDVLAWYVPIQFGRRTTYSAYIWRKGTFEPTGSRIQMRVEYIDKDGGSLSRFTPWRSLTERAVDMADDSADTRYNPLGPTPQRFAVSDQPPAEAKYAYCVLRLITPSAANVADLVWAVSGVQAELPTNNLAPNTNARNFSIIRAKAKQYTVVNPNPYFDQNITGWSAVGNATLSRDGSVGRTTAGSLKVTPDGATANPGASTDWIAIDRTQPYTFDVYVRSSVDDVPYEVELLWSSDGSTQLTTLPGSSGVSKTVTGKVKRQLWVNVNWTSGQLGTAGGFTDMFEPPDTATHTKLRIKRSDAGVPTTAQGFWIDDAEIITSPVVNRDILDVSNTAIGSKVVATMDQDDVALVMRLAGHVPGKVYTATFLVRKVGSASVILIGTGGGSSVDSGAVLLTVEDAEIPVAITYTAKMVTEDVMFVPQPTTSDLPLFTQGQKIEVRNVVVEEGAHPLPQGGVYEPVFTGEFATQVQNGVTTWEAPKPIFEGWIENWPAETGDHVSTVKLDAHDRLARLGKITLRHTLQETLLADKAELVLPLDDDPIDSQGKVSNVGSWSITDKLDTVDIARMYDDIGSATYVLGVDGPSDDTALQLNRSIVNSLGKGYVLYVPFSRDFPNPRIPLKHVPPQAAPTLPEGTTYIQGFFATWSHTYDSSGALNGTDATDPNVYQGNGLRGLIGFNWQHIAAVLADSQVSEVELVLANVSWQLYQGGFPIIGTHTYREGVGPTTWSGNQIKYSSLIQDQGFWPREQQRSFLLGSDVAADFKDKVVTGISIGPVVNTSADQIGWFYGAKAEATVRPKLVFTFKK